MSPCGFVPRRSVDGGVVAPSRRVDAATDLHGDTRRAGRESAGTALLDWDIALLWPALAPCPAIFPASVTTTQRSEEPTSELQSLMRTSYAVFRLTKKHQHKKTK